VFLPASLAFSEQIEWQFTRSRGLKAGNAAQEFYKLALEFGLDKRRLLST
jgi:hypothetical protein